MRIAIVANATRGGVEPYASRARGLASAGHEVVASAPPDDRDLFGGAAASFVSLEGASLVGSVFSRCCGVRESVESWLFITSRLRAKGSERG